MQALPELFPEAVDDPLVLANMSRLEVFGRLRRDQREGGPRLKVSTNCWQAVKKIRLIAKDGFDGLADVQQLDALLHNFSKMDVSRCMEQWLVEQGWENIKPTNYKGANIALSAQKDGATFTGMALGSVWREINRYVRTGIREDGQYDYEEKPEISEDIPATKDRIGRIILILIQQMNEVKKCHAAMMVADDPSTRQAMQPFVKHIKRLRIHIYMVHSAEKVEEL